MELHKNENVLSLLVQKKELNFNILNIQKNSITLSDALKDVPDSVGSKYSEEKMKMLKHVPPGGSWVDMPVRFKKNTWEKVSTLLVAGVEWEEELHGMSHVLP